MPGSRLLVVGAYLLIKHLIGSSVLLGMLVDVMLLFLFFQYWDDQKQAVKMRCAAVRNHLAETGGNNPLDLLTEYDRRVLAVMGGWMRIVGFTSVVDPLEVCFAI